MPDKKAIIQKIIKHKGWIAIFSTMATWLRDEIKNNARQEAGGGAEAQRSPWSMALSSLPLQRPGRRKGGLQGRTEGEQGEPKRLPGVMGAQVSVLNHCFPQMVSLTMRSQWLFYFAKRLKPHICDSEQLFVITHGIFIHIRVTAAGNC